MGDRWCSGRIFHSGKARRELRLSCLRSAHLDQLESQLYESRSYEMEALVRRPTVRAKDFSAIAAT